MLSQRAEVEEETFKAAMLARIAFLKVTGKDPKSPLFALLAMEQMEMAAVNTLGGAGIRPFLSCYFGYNLDPR
jgi:hypothetical protein